MVSEYPGNNDTCVSSIMQAGLSCHFLLMYAMQYASRPLNVSLRRADVLHLTPAIIIGFLYKDCSGPHI